MYYLFFTIYISTVFCCFCLFAYDVMVKWFNTNYTYIIREYEHAQTVMTNTQLNTISESHFFSYIATSLGNLHEKRKSSN